MEIVEGVRINYLTVLKYFGTDKYRNRLWLCVCDCGKELQIRQSFLNTGRQQSCGCKSQLMLKNKHELPPNIFSSKDGECFTLPIDTPARYGYNNDKGFKLF